MLGFASLHRLFRNAVSRRAEAIPAGLSAPPEECREPAFQNAGPRRGRGWGRARGGARAGLSVATVRFPARPRPAGRGSRADPDPLGYPRGNWKLAGLVGGLQDR